MITSDNLRKDRRLIQGRGVNLRETVVAGAAYFTDIAVPGFKRGDNIISIIDLTDDADVGADLVAAVAASLAVQPGSHKGLDYTARKAGAEGNLVYVEYLDPGLPSSPLSVSVVRRVIGGNLATVVSVKLETNASSTLVSTAAQVRAAVLEQADAPGHPLAADVVDVQLHSGDNGSGVVAAYSATPLAGGSDDPTKSGVAASRTIFTLNKQVVWTARQLGAAGNGIGVSYVDPSAANQELSVTVSQTADGKVHVVVHLATDGLGAITTTALDVVKAVEDSAGTPGGPHGAADFVSASKGSGTGATVLTAQSELFLTGGSDSGSFQLSVDTAGNKLKVLWETSR